jgi:hypothetical protein
MSEATHSVHCKEVGAHAQPSQKARTHNHRKRRAALPAQASAVALTRSSTVGQEEVQLPPLAQLKALAAEPWRSSEQGSRSRSTPAPNHLRAPSHLECADDGLGNLVSHLLLRFPRGRAQVRRAHHVRPAHQRVVGRGGLRLKHVQACAHAYMQCQGVRQGARGSCRGGALACGVAWLAGWVAARWLLAGGRRGLSLGTTAWHGRPMQQEPAALRQGGTTQATSGSSMGSQQVLQPLALRSRAALPTPRPAPPCPRRLVQPFCPPAPATILASRARASAWSSITPPRATLMMNAPFFICARHKHATRRPASGK